MHLSIITFSTLLSTAWTHDVTPAIYVYLTIFLDINIQMIWTHTTVTDKWCHVSYEVCFIYVLFVYFYNQFTNNLIWLSPIIMNILCQYHHVFLCHFGNPIIFCIQKRECTEDDLNWQMVTHALSILHIRLIIILNNNLFVTYVCITQVKTMFLN